MAHSIYKFTSITTGTPNTTWTEVRDVAIDYNATQKIVSGDSAEPVLIGTYDKRARVTLKTNNLSCLIGVDPGDSFATLKLTSTLVGAATVATFAVSTGVIAQASQSQPWDGPGEGTVVFEAATTGASSVTIAWAAA